VTQIVRGTLLVVRVLTAGGIECCGNRESHERFSPPLCARSPELFCGHGEPFEHDDLDEGEFDEISEDIG
jgi:hypothetical protein